jgi:methionyl-tRNA synthetase
MKDIENAKGKVETALEQFKFRDALFEIIDLSRKGNKYLQEKEPWKKVSSDKVQVTSEENQKSVDNCLHYCLQLTANLAILINPFLPFTAKKMLHMMKVVDKLLDWENAGKLKLLSVGYSLREPQLLFRKIEDEEIKAQVEKLRANSLKAQGTGNLPDRQAGKVQVKQNNMEAQEQQETGNRKPEIQYNDFAKLELKVATVTACEKVEKADKLLKLEIDLGNEKRTIVSGIAQHYKPEEVLGKQVIVVTNLAPRKMKGIESQGMILTAEDKDGKLQLLKPEGLVSPGSNVS